MTGVARAEPLTAEAFAAFGVVLAAPAGIGRQGPYPIIADPRPDAARTMRRTLNSVLLPSERPRTVTVTEADHEGFHK